MFKRKIAVAGAGIGGLAAAALLARSGACVRVFDQFDRPKPIGSGLVIQPVGQAVLAAAGAEAAMAQGCRIRRMVGHDITQGRTVLDVAYDPRHGPRFGLGIHRAAPLDALLGAAAAAGAEVVPAPRVVGRAGPALVLADGQAAGAFGGAGGRAGAGQGGGS